mmetsp:Transcript_43430/g.69501  ORF Transcript_43430/g.69501 Transcript_43430/m.69501 type:complete len:307 (+) Transcript_43430:266-1186(+)
MQKMAARSGLRNRSRGSATVPSGRKRMQDSEADDGDCWRLFSENPDKAWAEKWFLVYSPVWPVIFVCWTVSGYHLDAGDSGNMLVTFLMALPNVVVPFVYCPTRDKPWYQMYWFKFLVWVWMFSFIASYFFTEYFFDVLGMVYNFPHLSWNFDSLLLGSGKQVVPLMMYVHAWYFFVTYHTCAVIFIRAIRTCPVFKNHQGVAWFFSVGFSAWLFAWGEIFGTTLEAIKDQFTYREMEWALTWGALLYSCYFLASFPMVFNLDERKGQSWSLQRTVESACAAGMVAFLMLDVAAQFIITEWKTKNF